MMHQQRFRVVADFPKASAVFRCLPRQSCKKAYFTEGALVKPIDKLSGSDFFPDIIGVKEHLSLGDGHRKRLSCALYRSDFRTIQL
jgi:hypothetical protein